MLIDTTHSPHVRLDIIIKEEINIGFLQMSYVACTIGQAWNHCI